MSIIITPPLLRRQRQAGITLLETLVFIMLLSVIIVAVVHATTLSLKRAQFNQKKLLATRYADEVAQWMRGEKESAWTTFAARSPGEYCMNTSITTCAAAGTCWDEATACAVDDFSLEEDTGLNNGHRRSVSLTTTGSRIDVAVSVAWKDGANEYGVAVNNSLSRWE